jgi:hypothetical protein
VVSPSVPPPAVPFPPTNEGRTAIETTTARWTDDPRRGGMHGQGTSTSGGEGIGGVAPPEKGRDRRWKWRAGGRRGAGSGNGGAAVAVLEEEEQDLG